LLFIAKLVLSLLTQYMAVKKLVILSTKVILRIREIICYEIIGSEPRNNLPFVFLRDD